MQVTEHVFWYPLWTPVRQFFGRGFSCNVFVIDQGDSLWLIDVGTYTIGKFNQLWKNIKKDGLDPMKITKVFITHAHPDHINAIPKIQQKIKDLQFYAYKQEKERLAGGYPYFLTEEKKICEQFGFSLGNFLGPEKILRKVINFPMGRMPFFNKANLLEDYEIVKGPRYSIQCIHTPGHTKGHAIYYIPELQMIFAGDLLDPAFDHKPPLNFPTGDYAQFRKSIEKIGVLSVETFCCSHQRRIHTSIDFYQDLIKGTLKSFDLAESIVIQTLRDHSEPTSIQRFKNRFPITIWEKSEHLPLAFSILRYLIEMDKVKQNQDSEFILIPP